MLSEPTCSKASRPRGFTLIELMITMVIVAILAAVAYPSYNNAVLKGRRAEGRTALADLLQQEERYLTQNGHYLVFDSTTGSVPFQRHSGDDPLTAPYLLAAAACPGDAADPPTDCIEVRAIPNTDHGRFDPDVGTLFMRSSGVRSCTGTFKDSNPKLCWP